MKIKDVLLSATVLLFLCTATVNAQNCNCPPSSVAGLEHRVNVNYYDKVDCREYSEETICTYACNYVLRSNPSYEIIVTVSWVKNVKPNTTYRCNKYPEGYSLGSSAKLAWGRTYLSKFREDISAEAKRIAQNLIGQVEPYAAACPGLMPGNNNNSNNNTADKETFCRQSAKKLSDLQLRIAAIESELFYLENRSTRESQCRELLSYYNKLIAALNTPGYNGVMKADVDKIKNDSEFRMREAYKVGVNPNMDAINIARSIRNVLQDRLEFLLDAPAFISNYNTQKQLTELDIARIRSEMSQRQCGGRYDFVNCNIAGNWRFTYFRGKVKEAEETWEFAPSGTGRYSGITKAGDNQGTAEVYGNDIILRSSCFGATINHKIVLSGGCYSGAGVRKIAGNHLDSLKIKVERVQGIRDLFVQNKLYSITYNGQNYQGLYQLDTKGAVPVDVFYFKILKNNGFQVEQDGEKLWGRFVRVPSVTQDNQSNPEWWYVNWIYKNGLWVLEEQKGVTVSVF